MNFLFLNVDSVKALHEQQISSFGGLQGVRDEGLLESAVLRPKMKALYQPSTTVAMLAASLAWGLVKNNAFLDGNKRVALAGMVVFLELNGHRLNTTEAEEIAMVLRAAASEITEDEWTAWVQSVVVSG